MKHIWNHQLAWDFCMDIWDYSPSDPVEPWNFQNDFLDLLESFLQFTVEHVSSCSFHGFPWLFRVLPFAQLEDNCKKIQEEWNSCDVHSCLLRKLWFKWSRNPTSILKWLNMDLTWGRDCLKGFVGTVTRQCLSTQPETILIVPQSL